MPDNDRVWYCMTCGTGGHHNPCRDHARKVRRGSADTAIDMRAGDGWIMPLADAIAAGLIEGDDHA